jgi:hypothetical protein
VELRLKALVGEGSKFLPSPTDPITLSQTHSVRWLALIVCQIIRKVRWENEFKCEGVSSLGEFGAVVAELESLDPVSCAVRASSRGRVGSVPPQYSRPTSFDSQESWTPRSTCEFEGGSDFGPTIQ